MKIFIGALGFGISGVYLFIRIKYLSKHRFSGFKNKILHNIIDFILASSIFILSFRQLRGAWKPAVEGSPSYIKHILILFIIYIIWMKINVSYYRKRSAKG